MRVDNFIVADICSFDFSDYIDSIPRIGFVYSAPPNIGMFNWWYKNDNKPAPKHLYQDLLGGFFTVLRKLNAEEYHIEYECKELKEVLHCFSAEYKNVRVLDVKYSAPTRGKGFAKRTKCTKIISFSNNEIRAASGEYSHQLLNSLLEKRTPINCYDPFMGRGLLAKIGSINGHKVYGSDISENRLIEAKKQIDVNQKNK